ncbi:MAG: hypothetical protein OEW88_03350 [Gammaproteobacteria bacterium]|nr:hypothetical protein [Gammaproteobacteria bacterium]
MPARRKRANAGIVDQRIHASGYGRVGKLHRAPFAASNSAIARPVPRLAPVTATIRAVRSFEVSMLLSVRILARLCCADPNRVAAGVADVWTAGTGLGR